MASIHPPGGASGEQETLFEFPCRFPVKAMGRSEEGFEALVTKIILSHADLYNGEQITVHPSSSGNFISVTIPIEAVSKDQLDRIYQELTDCKQVLVAL